MKIKKDLEISTSEFWYDVGAGGYLDPFDICENIEDANKIAEAINTLKEFETSCEQQIEGFIQ